MRTIQGIHAVREALTGDPARVRKIVLVEGRLDERLARIASLARERGVPLYREPRERLRRYGGHHQGVVAELADVGWLDLETLLSRLPTPALLLVLDQVEDPRNLGAVVRVADGAGVDGIVIPARRTAPFSEAAVAASAGALHHVTVARVGNLAESLRRLKEAGLWVVGLQASAPTPWYEFDFTSPVAVVVGSEGKGLRPRVAAGCDALVSLPQLGKVDSLNLSVAAGIVLYEVVRQRISRK
ncbi:MAG TPA: 23S rRNA (guanosine(2251)-2'-O)-methyltransferase RlmB [Vicinamibacteria bacterium]|nr:23S rRNA (guanosine(2251)-2'-O)-methyltransferase RlmB [Vicinamibacteria bacterium]